jgi:hypothetical protein
MISARLTERDSPPFVHGDRRPVRGCDLTARGDYRRHVRERGGTLQAERVR